MKKRNDETCVWEWEVNYPYSGFNVKCDRGYSWQYKRIQVIEDFKFCPHCGKKVEVKK